MKKMLYLCAVEWKWIAQRPQFLEMELEKYYDVTVLSPVHFMKDLKNQKNTILPSKYQEFTLLPYQEKVGAIRWFSKLLFRLRVRNLHDYDIIWLGSSLFEKYIPNNYKGLIVFDYMDDCVSIQQGPKMKKAYTDSQRRLEERAGLITVTSLYLKDLLPKSVMDITVLIRNAFRGNTVIPPSAKSIKSELDSGKDVGMPLKIGYVGTISAWMDFDLLRKCAERFQNIEFHFWGPADVKVEETNNIILHGVAEHDELPGLVEDMDALHMPFIVNDIVKAVDPVKLYEYISYGKPIISVKYDEVERFSDFVWLYEGEEEYHSLINKLAKNELPQKYDAQSQKAFLIENTWSERAKVVHDAVEKAIESRERRAQAH